uniref:Uncharacterized protein n=1 Tax=Rhizophora mucronata TaxID=61149 RepID=A0A2P2IR04_RHIMU
MLNRYKPDPVIVRIIYFKNSSLFYFFFFYAILKITEPKKNYGHVFLYFNVVNNQKAYQDSQWITASRPELENSKNKQKKIKLKGETNLGR